jgi:hypothetical protein
MAWHRGERPAVSPCSASPIHVSMTWAAPTVPYCSTMPFRCMSCLIESVTIRRCYCGCQDPCGGIFEDLMANSRWVSRLVGTISVCSFRDLANQLKLLHWKGGRVV